jgi:hypothetical protein
MHILQRFLRVPLVRSLLGAAGGTVVALLLYYTFQAGSQALATLMPSGTPYIVSSRDNGPVNPEAARRVGAAARIILAKLDAH